MFLCNEFFKSRILNKNLKSCQTKKENNENNSKIGIIKVKNKNEKFLLIKEKKKIQFISCTDSDYSDSVSLSL